VIEDIKVGKGPAAKQKDTVRLRYVGKYVNDAVFDAMYGEKPIEMKLDPELSLPAFLRGCHRHEGWWASQVPLTANANGTGNPEWQL